MKTVTLRFPEVSYRRLVRLCELHGVTMRGVFEATILLTYDDIHDPERWAQTVRIWETARKLEESPGFRSGPRRRVNAKLADDVAEMFTQKCREFGVSQNAALGLICTPWPEEDSDAYRAYRRENLDRIVTLARQRDFSRRPYATTV